MSPPPLRPRCPFFSSIFTAHRLHSSNAQMKKNISARKNSKPGMLGFQARIASITVFANNSQGPCHVLYLLKTTRGSQKVPARKCSSILPGHRFTSLHVPEYRNVARMFQTSSPDSPTTNPDSLAACRPWGLDKPGTLRTRSSDFREPKKPRIPSQNFPKKRA